MAIINARMRQKRGPIAQLDKDKLLPGEFAIPEDSDKIYICIKAGVVLEMPSTQSIQGVFDTLNAVVTQGTQMIDDFRQLELDKVGIDDNNVSTMTTYSSDKITELINEADSAENTVTFESNDSKENVTWTDVPVLSSAEKHKSIFGKISTMFKNVRYLYKMLGTTDISSIEDGTLTGAVAKLISNLSVLKGYTCIIRSVVAFNGNFGAYSGAGFEVSLPTINGFVPIGIVGESYNNVYVRCISKTISNNVLNVYAFNTLDATFENAVCDLVILYVKNVTFD